jgi:hypothetical protein
VIKNLEDLHCTAVEKRRKEKLTTIEDGGYKSLICKQGVWQREETNS